MKKFISVITLLFMLIAPTFAKQFSIVYDTTMMDSETISAKINNYLNHGYKLVSMVAISNKRDKVIAEGFTTSIIVVFDDCME
jgi:hypothetical protein